jgi:hypothetical protein
MIPPSLETGASQHKECPVRRLIFRTTAIAVAFIVLSCTLPYLNPQTDAQAQGRPNVRLPIPLPAPEGSLDFART